MNAVYIQIGENLRKLADSIEALTKEIQKSPEATEEVVSKTATENAITLEEVRAKLAALTQSGKQAEVKKLIKKHGGKKLSDIPEDKYSDLLKDAEEI